MTNAELDRLMGRVLSDAIALDQESAYGPGIVFRPSPHHSAQMRLMLADPLYWVKKRKRSALRKAAGWAAVFLLFISLAFSMAMLFSPEARAAVEHWVAEWYQTHIVYRYFGSGEGLPRYEFTGLPEGFTEIMRQEEAAFVDILYGKENGELISFSYQAIQQGGAAGFILNGDDVSEVTIGRNQGTLFIPRDPEDLKTLTWVDEKAGVQFTIAADLEEPELIRLAESLRKLK